MVAKAGPGCKPICRRRGWWERVLPRGASKKYARLDTKDVEKRERQTAKGRGSEFSHHHKRDSKIWDYSSCNEARNELAGEDRTRQCFSLTCRRSGLP